MRKIALCFMVIFALLVPSGILVSADAPVNILADFEDGVLSQGLTNNISGSAIVENEGKGGTRGLLIPGNDQHRYLATTEIPMLDTGDKNLVISYDLRVSKIPTTLLGTGNIITFLGGQRTDGGYNQLNLKYDVNTQKVVFGVRNSTDVDEVITTDKWYRIVVFYKGGTQNRYTYLMSETGDVLWSGHAWDNAYDVPSVFGLVMIPYGAPSDMELVVDNIAVNVYDPSEAPQLLLSTVKDGEEDILRNQKMCFTFNQLIDTSSEISVKDSSGSSVAVTAAIANNSAFISFDSLLEKKETYTIYFENVTNANGIASSAQSISFTTESVHLMEPPAIQQITPAGNKLTIDFALNDPFDYSYFTGVAVAAVYDNDGCMAGFDAVFLDNVQTGNLSEEFSLDISGNNIQRVKLMLFDTAEGLTPLSVQEATIS